MQILLPALAEAADQTAILAKMDIHGEIERRQQRLAQLAEAKAVLGMRAKARYEVEKAAYEAKLRQQEAKASKRGQKPRGRKPKPPKAGPRDRDQYNFTDPDSAIPAALGTPEAAALDAGYWSEDNVEGLQARGIDP